MDISGVFRCFRRPILTRICLERIVEILDDSGYSYELVAVYDDSNQDYIDMLTEFPFKHIVVNPRQDGANKDEMGHKFNEALDKCKGDYTLHLENDFYWVKPCLDAAIDALQHMDVVRLCLSPYSIRGAGKKFENSVLFNDNRKYKFTLNPHLRKQKYPAGRFASLSRWKMESDYALRFNDPKRGLKSGMLLEDYVSHVGVCNNNGKFRQYHLIYVYGQDWADQYYSMDVQAWFNTLTDSPRHRTMFKKYLKTTDYKRIVYNEH